MISIIDGYSNLAAAVWDSGKRNRTGQTEAEMEFSTNTEIVLRKQAVGSEHVRSVSLLALYSVLFTALYVDVLPNINQQSAEQIYCI